MLAWNRYVGTCIPRENTLIFFNVLQVFCCTVNILKAQTLLQLKHFGTVLHRNGRNKASSKPYLVTASSAINKKIFRDLDTRVTV